MSLGISEGLLDGTIVEKHLVMQSVVAKARWKDGLSVQVYSE